MRNLLFVGASAKPKRVAACLSVVMGLACSGLASVVAAELSRSPAQPTVFPAQVGYLTWAELIQFAASTLCEVVQCGGVAGRSESASDQVAGVVEAVIDAYRAEGVIPGLSQSAIRDGINAVDFTLYLVDAPESTLSPGLAAEFRGALVELRGDLQSKLVDPSAH